MTARAIGKLQSLDSAGDAAQRRRAELDGLTSDTRALSEAQEHRDGASRDLAKVRKELTSREEETGALESKMRDLESRLYGGHIRNPKELDNLERELTMFRHQHERLDEAALALMDALEQAQVNDAAAQATLERASADRTQNLSRWMREREVLDSDSSERMRQMQILRSELDEDTLAAYDRMRRRMPLVAAPVRHGTCGVCGIGLSNEVAEQARSEADLARCDNCGRLLYVE